jgi:hypothetical protein
MKNKMKIIGNIYCAGVYCLKNFETEEVLLVGSGIECNDRLSWYLYHLKRDLFEGTNKEPLQAIYDRGLLVFEMLHISEHSSEVKDMTDKEKEPLQQALSVLEKMYIDLYKDTVLNVQMSVIKRSSNKDKFSTIKRRRANIGSKNPRSIYDEKIICEILWINKNTDLQPKEIIKHYEGLIKQGYISRIGLDRFIYSVPVKPDWYKGENEKVVPMSEIDTTLGA